MNENEFRSCAEACRQCAEQCELWAQQNAGGSVAIQFPEFVALNADCRQLSCTAAGFLERGSHFIADICTLLAHVCDALIAAGEEHPDLGSQAYIEACRECANECRMVLAIHAA